MPNAQSDPCSSLSHCLPPSTPSSTHTPVTPHDLSCLTLQPKHSLHAPSVFCLCFSFPYCLCISLSLSHISIPLLSHFLPSASQSTHTDRHPKHPFFQLAHFISALCRSFSVASRSVSLPLFPSFVLFVSSVSSVFPLACISLSV